MTTSAPKDDRKEAENIYRTSFDINEFTDYEDTWKIVEDILKDDKYTPERIQVFKDVLDELEERYTGRKPKPQQPEEDTQESGEKPQEEEPLKSAKKAAKRPAQKHQTVEDSEGLLTPEEWRSWAKKVPLDDYGVKVVLIGLMDHCNPQGTFFIGADKLSVELSMSVSTVTRAYTSIKEMGLITRIGMVGRARKYQVNAS